MRKPTLLVHVECDNVASQARVDLACSLAARMQATLIGVAVVQPEAPTAQNPDDSLQMLVRAETDRLNALTRSAEASFRASACQHGVIVEWHGSAEEFGDALLRESCKVDLVIVGSSNVSEQSHVLMSCGRPVLLAPVGMRALSLRTALVAWKDTREARRALTDSLPLLTCAEQVVVVRIVENNWIQDGSDEISRPLRYLERHGIPARGEIVTESSGRVSHDLLTCAQNMHADIVIAGAYGHSRLREWLFGGVTMDLLNQSDVCCVLSH